MEKNSDGSSADDASVPAYDGCRDIPKYIEGRTKSAVGYSLFLAILVVSFPELRAAEDLIGLPDLRSDASALFAMAQPIAHPPLGTSRAP